MRGNDKIDMEIIIAVTIAVIGWLINHHLSIRAQEKSFINQVKNTARSEIASSLRDYHELLVNLGRAKGMLDYLCVMSEGLLDSIPVQDGRIDNFINLCSETSLTVSPNVINIIEEYETLFPQTAKVRDYLQNKHIYIFHDFRTAANHIRETKLEITLMELETILEKIDRFGIPAQLWIIKDFLVCIQNLSLGEITGKAVIPKKLSVGTLEVKHPRLIMDSKNNIIITKSKYSSNQKKI